MCGIIGIASFSDKVSQHKKALEDGLKTLHKRGPDHADTYVSEQCLLGHVRLSIIDTSAAGNQPFYSPDGRYVMVFNGEIFNFKELKNELESQGEIFNTNSDTEILLRLYILQGEKCLPKLNGFFAFSIWDTKRKELFSAVDRYGIKPFYYYQGAYFAFASQLGALLSFPFERKINTKALEVYFHLQYIPAPLSMLEGVRKLPAGSFLKINSTQTHPQVHKYYEFSIKKSEDSYEDAKSNIRSLIEDSIEKRLISDVPVACFLSGGIDSSIVASLAAKKLDSLHTFSIGYKDEPYFDETKYAKLVADKIGSTHTVFSLSNQDLYDHVEDVLDSIDEPFADSSAVAVYILSKKVSDEFKVTLSGDAADELFSGYHKHMAEWKMRNQSFKEKLAISFSPLANFITSSRKSKLGNLARQLKKFASASKLTAKERYWNWAGFSNQNSLSSLLSDSQDFSKEKNDWLKYVQEEEQGINDVLLTDLNIVLQGDMLVKVDRMSMANSLEVRSPFLDYRLIDYVNTLPSEYKIDGILKKKILQEAFKEELPEALFNRPKKGFEIPLESWLKNQLKIQVANAFDEKFIERQGLFNSKVTNALYQKFMSNNVGDSAASVWAMLVFQRWYGKYMTN